MKASGRAERGSPRLGKVCSASCQPHCPSLPLYAPGAFPLHLSRLAGYLPVQGQGKWEAPGQVGIERAAKRVLQPLKLGGTGQWGEAGVGLHGWAFQAGGTSLLLGFGLCSEGRSQQAGVFGTQ